MTLLTTFTIWLLLWIIVFGIFFVMKLNGKGVTYVHNYGLTVIFFILSTILAINIFDFPFEKIAITPLAISSLIALYILSLSTYSLAKKLLKPPQTLLKKYPDHYWITLDYRYLISKSFEILFQQTMIIIGVWMLYNAGFSLLKTITYFFIIFGFIHLIGISTAGKTMGIFYLLASLIGALFFPILIIASPDGFIYSYIVHFLFYIIAGIVVWIYQQNK
ncbi:MAG: hypothetical protein Q7R96_04105 [Nanoarchaeota archaeon]|nr:hypothetical protein [Nanoarchaeota archaeon]